MTHCHWIRTLTAVVVSLNVASPTSTAVTAGCVDTAQLTRTLNVVLLALIAVFNTHQSTHSHTHADRQTDRQTDIAM